MRNVVEQKYPPVSQVGSLLVVDTVDRVPDAETGKDDLSAEGSCSAEDLKIVRLLTWCQDRVVHQKRVALFDFPCVVDQAVCLFSRQFKVLEIGASIAGRRESQVIVEISQIVGSYFLSAHSCGTPFQRVVCNDREMVVEKVFRDYVLERQQILCQHDRIWCAGT